MRWPWSRRKAETRSAEGFTALSMLARADAITGRAGAAELTATVQGCIALWENGLSLADVDGGAGLLTPRALALIARSLALRGEYVALIGDGALIPASGWTVSAQDGAARAYRLELPGSSGGRTVTALAGEVAHVVIGADTRTPWQGSSPLARASLTADLLATVEAAMADVYRAAPLGSQIAPMPEMTADDAQRLASSFRGQRGRVLLRESVVATAAGGPVPATDWRPSSLTPNMSDSGLVETLDRAQAAVAVAYGIDPSFFSQTANGGGLREAQRHLATWTLSPVAALIAQELGAKLGAPVALDVLRPLQAFDAGGRARAFSAMVRAMSEAKAAGLSDDEIGGLLRLIDWSADA